MGEWLIEGRFTFRGHAIVEARNELEAKSKFEDGSFEFDFPTAECCDWEVVGKPKENK